MRKVLANYSKGQIKIQQMAFVLVALLIFFAMVFVFYISIRTSNLQGDAEDLRDQENRETIRQITGSPEFSWTSAGDCAACIDLDKVFVLSENAAYKDFWKNVPILRIERIHPNFGGVLCDRANYPECDIISVVSENTDTIADSTFVSLCRYNEEGYNECDIGKVVMGYETIGVNNE